MSDQQTGSSGPPHAFVESHAQRNLRATASHSRNHPAERAWRRHFPGFAAAHRKSPLRLQENNHRRQRFQPQCRPRGRNHDRRSRRSCGGRRIRQRILLPLHALGHQPDRRRDHSVGRNRGHHRGAARSPQSRRQDRRHLQRRRFHHFARSQRQTSDLRRRRESRSGHQKLHRAAHHPLSIPAVSGAASAAA